MRICVLISVIIFCLNTLLFAQDNSSKSMTDNSSNRNIIEFELGGGAFSNVFFGASDSVIDQDLVLIPFAKLRLRVLDGISFVPEIEIKESGYFKFDRYQISSKVKDVGYNSYYIKLPLMLKIPFFTYDAMINIDGRFSSFITLETLQQDLKINRELYLSGKRISSITSELETRLFLDTPIISKSNFFNHSYFGVYYSEDIIPRLVSPPSTIVDNKYYVNAVTRNGGIFYEMRNDTALKGLNFLINLSLGYGDIYLLDDTTLSRDNIGNISNLLIFKIRAGLNYRYIFNRYFGLDINFQMRYNLATNFFSAEDTSKYSMNIDDDFRYEFNLSILTAF